MIYKEDFNMRVLLFSNDKCGSCRKWKPTFERLMGRYGLDYEVIDTYDPANRDMRERYGISGIPDTIFVDGDGAEVGHVLGNMTEELAIRQIEHYIANAGD